MMNIKVLQERGFSTEHGIKYTQGKNNFMAGMNPHYSSVLLPFATIHGTPARCAVLTRRVKMLMEKNPEKSVAVTNPTDFSFLCSLRLRNHLFIEYRTQIDKYLILRLQTIPCSILPLYLLHWEKGKPVYIEI